MLVKDLVEYLKSKDPEAKVKLAESRFNHVCGEFGYHEIQDIEFINH